MVCFPKPGLFWKLSSHGMCSCMPEDLGAFFREVFSAGFQKGLCDAGMRYEGEWRDGQEHGVGTLWSQMGLPTTASGRRESYMEKGYCSRAHIPAALQEWNSTPCIANFRQSNRVR